jgi:8-oxo-dGTP diphosphatase
LSTIDISKLPSTFYRVTVKALIFDEQHRLLVCVNDEDGYEIPGGGWEHGESMSDCLARELDEELGLQLDSVGPVVGVYDMRSPFREVPVIRIVVRATVAPGTPTPGDTIVGSRYVTEEEFLALNIEKFEGPVQEYAEAIWAGAP